MSQVEKHGGRKEQHAPYTPTQHSSESIKLLAAAVHSARMGVAGERSGHERGDGVRGRMRHSDGSRRCHRRNAATEPTWKVPTSTLITSGGSRRTNIRLSQSPWLRTYWHPNPQARCSGDAAGMETWRGGVGISPYRVPTRGARWWVYTVLYYRALRRHCSLLNTAALLLFGWTVARVRDLSCGSCAEVRASGYSAASRRQRLARLVLCHAAAAP